MARGDDLASSILGALTSRDGPASLATTDGGLDDVEAAAWQPMIDAAVKHG